MKSTKGRAGFDPKHFLHKVSDGLTIADYKKNHNIFSQGDPADAIYYTHRGKIKLSVVSKQGKEAVVGILGAGDFFGEGCLAGQETSHDNRVRLIRVFRGGGCKISRDPRNPRGAELL